MCSKKPVWAGARMVVQIFKLSLCVWNQAPAEMQIIRPMRNVVVPRVGRSVSRYGPLFPPQKRNKALGMDPCTDMGALTSWNASGHCLPPPQCMRHVALRVCCLRQIGRRWQIARS